MRGYVALLAVGLLVLAFCTQANAALSDFSIAGTYTTPDGFSMPYRLYVPADYDPSVSYPLTVYMHGLGKVGDNNTAQCTGAIDPLLAHLKTAEYSSLLLAPQTPGTWSDWSTPVITGMIENLMTQYSVDRQRLYATGYSLGGSGVWTQISNQPDYFAAAVPISGGGDPRRAYLMTEQNLWNFHGEADTVVAVKNSREPIEAIRAQGGTPLYTEYPGAGHGISGTVYNDLDMYDWMFAQRGAGTLRDEIRPPQGPHLRFEKQDLGDGLTGYTFYIQNEIYFINYGTYNVSAAFRGVGGATIQQIRTGGIFPVETEEEADQVDGTYGYTKSLDSWVTAGWQLAPGGLNPFDGSTFYGVQEEDNLFATCLYSGAGSSLWTGVPVAYVVANGEVEWGSRINYRGEVYDSAGATPEPATLALLAMGAVAALRRRRGR